MIIKKSLLKKGFSFFLSVVILALYSAFTFIIGEFSFYNVFWGLIVWGTIIANFDDAIKNLGDDYEEITPALEKTIERKEGSMALSSDVGEGSVSVVESGLSEPM